MSKFISEFKYELNLPIEYAAGPDMAQGTYLTVKAPAAVLRDWLSTIEQEVGKSFKSLSEGAANEKEAPVKVDVKPDENESAEGLVLFLSSSADLNKCYAALKVILTYSKHGKVQCLINGTEPLTEPLFDSLAYQDLKVLLGLYIQNFIVTSLKV